MKEYWKIIPNYEDYQVSNKGRVRNISKTIPKILSQVDNGNGYFRVHLYNKQNTRPKKHYIHRLVAQMFLTNPRNLKYVHHKEHKKYKNTVDDLMWVTASENNRYKIQFYSKQKST